MPDDWGFPTRVKATVLPSGASTASASRPDLVSWRRCAPSTTKMFPSLISTVAAATALGPVRPVSRASIHTGEESPSRIDASQVTALLA